MDGQGSIPPLDLDAMRSLSKQRLPIQSKHVEALLEYVEQIQREARNNALEEAITKAEYAFAAAPDMYEALSPLEEFATQMAADAPEWDSTDSVKVYLTIGQLRCAVSALAKARGE